MANLSEGRIWAVLFFSLIVIISLTSVFGYVEVIVSSLKLFRTSSFLKSRRARTFYILGMLFLAALVFTSHGGVHVYHLLLTYIYDWPTILFCFLTVFITNLCQGVHSLVNNISVMNRLSLHPWLSSHLSVLYYSVLPVLLMVQKD